LVVECRRITWKKVPPYIKYAIIINGSNQGIF